jgi:hypothetical protein
MVTPELVEAHAYKATIDERIAELWFYRSWYRARPWTLDWPSRADNLVELRHLVRLAREARALARPAIERADPITAYQGWTEAEKAYTR